jgi:Na+-translocating ferredoxin:NAD+ oxidoreductase RnfG subunit
VQHGVLHRDLQTLALAGGLLLVERTQHGDGEQHAGAGVAQGGARFDGRVVGIAADAHHATRGLGDHIEGEIVSERLPSPKPLTWA